MSLQINRGLAKFDCVDYHAILGIPISAEANEVRKRYLKIARSLHPDSCTKADKQLASRLLSKLVNPAYEKLSQGRERAEHDILLQMLSQRLTQEKNSIELQSESAKQLLQANNPDTFYKAAVQDLATNQYQSLEQTLELTEQLSELNLAYLTAKGTQGKKPHLMTTAGAITTPTASTNDPTTTTGQKQDSASLSTETFVSQYYRRAEEFLANDNFPKAMLELRDALKLEPNNSRCHSLLGKVYLQQNQTTMARVHFNQALKADPKNSMALAGRSHLEKLDTKAKSKGSPDRGGGGLFGLFGGRKK